jgi:hypothetical protein
MRKNKQKLILQRRTLMNDQLFRTLLKRYDEIFKKEEDELKESFDTFH